jgi:hypothetical protein
VACAPHRANPQTDVRPPGRNADQPDSTLGFRVTTGCSTVRPRTAFALISWPAGRSALVGARLESTIYYDGFARGLYYGVPAVPRARFRPQQDSARTMAPTAAALARLAVDSVTVDSGRVVLHVEPLEPGVNYAWRITTPAANGPIASQVVRVQAPTCVYDAPSPREEIVPHP